MPILRTFTSAIEAELAKSYLQAAGIVCELADENANLYGGGPIAMPVRLLVAESQIDEARDLLAKAPGLPRTSSKGEEWAQMEEEAPDEIATALRSVRRANFWILLISITGLLVSFYVLSEIPGRTQTEWSAVSQARRRLDYERAIQLSRKLVAANPRDYYAHEYLGDIFVEAGRFEEAEEEFVQAYDLAPPQSLPAKLAKVRERLGRPLRPGAAASPGH